MERDHKPNEGFEIKLNSDGEMTIPELNLIIPEDQNRLRKSVDVVDGKLVILEPEDHARRQDFRNRVIPPNQEQPRRDNF